MVTEEISELTIELLKISKTASRASRRIWFAFQEADQDDSYIPDAAHFLKLDGRRLGRDIELYAFMAKVAAPQQALLCFLEEVYLPMKSVDHTAALAVAPLLKSLGESIYSGDLLQQWKEFFVDTNERAPQRCHKD